MTARELHGESRLEKLCKDKRDIIRHMNDVKHSDDPSDARIQCYIEELQDLENEIIRINVGLDSLQNM